MHVISMNDFGPDNPIENILASASRMIEWGRRNTCDKQYPHSKAVLLFLERSTRTQYSTEQAVMNLGMRHTMVSGADHTSVLKGESMADTFRMYAGQGARIIAIRSSLEGTPLHGAKICQQYIEEQSILNPGPVSIINCGDGCQWHPTQAVLDCTTIMQTLGRLDNFRLGVLGDPGKGRTAHTLVSELSKKPGMSFVFVAPQGLEMPEQYKHGLENMTESDSLDALADCDIVYVTRFQTERMPKEQQRYVESIRHKFIITEDVLNSWNPNIRIMHPLPRVDEIAPEISLDKRLIAFQQAEYGIVARMAIISMLCEGPFKPIDLNPRPPVLLADSKERIIDKQKPVKHFQPIDKGTVVDHIPAGKMTLIFRVLETLGGFQKKSPRQAVQYVNSGKYQNGKKDVLLLYDYQLPELCAATLQTMFPGVTINYLPGNNTIIKKKFNAPLAIDKNVCCSNQACITNHDREAKPRFIFLGKEGEERFVSCEYCGSLLWP